jgi:TatD DNase family protein
MIGTKQLLKEDTKEKQLTEMADAHCHLDLVNDPEIIRQAVSYGVRTIITNGVDTKSNIRSMEIADNRNIFALLGIDPEHANVTKEELEFNINLIRQNAKKISGIGEIGMDYGKVKDKVPVEKQRMVFETFLDLAKELDLPVSVHSRDAMDYVIQILSEKEIKSAHIHFFEGSVQQAREVVKKGWMISVPPLISNKRSKVIKEVAIDNIMAESDSPVVGASPRDVEKSIRIVAEAKILPVERAAELLTKNTKKFFRIHKDMLIRF